MRASSRIGAVLVVVGQWAASAGADSVFFSTGDVDGRMAMASRPDSAGKLEIEAADDFVLTNLMRISGATFTGLIPGNGSLADIADIRVEIYRVFPLDSTVPPSMQVPTRVNSPSDVEFADRSASAHTLTFTTAALAGSFTAGNSVLNGIHPAPNFNTLGEGPVTGKEVQINVAFSTPFILDANHYFFVPQVQLTNGDFFWLSATRPIVPPGISFPPGFTDLQAWIRNDALDPDWLRVGTDIVGGNLAPTFNAAFSLTGSSVPEPSSVFLLGTGVVVLAGLCRRRSK